jgi:hypothetical protein
MESQGTKLTLLPVVSAVAWSVVYSYGPMQIITTVGAMILRDFFLCGFVVSTILW